MAGTEAHAVTDAPGRWKPWAAAALGGALYFLGYLGFGAWPLLAVFLVPLWWAIEASRPRGPAVAAGLGLAFGAVAYAGGYPWLWALVEEFLAGQRLVGAALFALHGLWFAAGYALYALLVRGLRGRGWPLAVAGVPPLLVVEWLQPRLFPVNAGAGLVLAPPLAQIADLGGPLLLTAFVGALNVVVFELCAAWRGARARPIVAALAGAALLAGAVGYGRVREAQLARRSAAAPLLRVGVVQANLGLVEKRTRGVTGHRRHLEQTRALLAEGPLDLVVWPETAYVRGLRRPLPLDGEPIRAELDVPLLFGGTSVFEQGGRRVSANSALLVGSDGRIRDAYDKNLLIPLAEYAPLASVVPAIASLFPHVQDFHASDAVPPLRLGPLRVSTPICYEVVRADFVRRMVREARPHLIVTLANDAWFGDSQEPWIHLALARLRAVEHRTWLVRSTNSGVSAVVDPTGRVVARTGLLTRESLRAEVRALEAGAPYTTLGDWPGPLALLVMALALGIPAPRRERR